MNDADFIIALMKTETDALGFIPSSAIRERWYPRGQYIIQRNSHGRRVGYLLHGIPRPGKPLHVNQVCVDLDDRRRRYAAIAVGELLCRARTAGAPKVLLRCAADLEANAFWLSMGFVPTHTEVGGKRRNRLIVHYELELSRNLRLQLRPRSSIGTKTVSKYPPLEEPLKRLSRPRTW